MSKTLRAKEETVTRNAEGLKAVLTRLEIIYTDGTWIVYLDEGTYTLIKGHNENVFIVESVEGVRFYIPNFKPS